MKIIMMVLSIAAIIIFTIFVFVLFNLLQAELCVPRIYLMWIFKEPASHLVIIYEIYAFIAFFYITNRDMKEIISRFIKWNKRFMITIFVILNIGLFYYILTAVTVITNNKIINYSITTPFGKEFSYSDIVKINTGVYGTGRTKGDFYYIIELKDGSKIDITQLGGAKNNEDERFIIERLDKKWVNMGIPKTASMDNFNYAKKELAKIYTDKIQNIIKNTK